MIHQAFGKYVGPIEDLQEEKAVISVDLQSSSPLEAKFNNFLVGYGDDWHEFPREHFEYRVTTTLEEENE